MFPQNTKCWVAVFQTRADTVEPLGYIPIGFTFAALSPPINNPVSSFSDPLPPMFYPHLPTTKRLHGKSPTDTTTTFPLALLETALPPGTGIGQA